MQSHLIRDMLQSSLTEIRHPISSSLLLFFTSMLHSHTFSSRFHPAREVEEISRVHSLDIIDQVAQVAP